MLPLASDSHRVLSGSPAQRVAQLVAVEFCALWNTEVGAILEVGEADFVAHGQTRGIGHRIIWAECWNGVQEPVAVEDEAVDHARRNNSCPVH